MTKHHHQGKAEQIDNKADGAAPFHYAKMPYQVSESDDNSIQVRAYQIHQEKGGHALDNWLEAEQFLKNSDQDVSRLINEGDPNKQK